jgi:hypothetical protein
VGFDEGNANEPIGCFGNIMSHFDHYIADYSADHDRVVDDNDGFAVGAALCFGGVEALALWCRISGRLFRLSPGPADFLFAVLLLLILALEHWAASRQRKP